MRTKVFHHMIKRYSQVLKERDFCAWLIIPRHHFVKNGEVARLLDIGNRSENKPARVIIETATNVVVASLGKRLILVIATSVGELCGSDVNDALAGS